MSTRALRRCASLLALLLSLHPTLARAVNQARAGINLGSTSFFDGFGRSSAGFTYQSYFQYAAARAILDRNGNDVSIFQNPRIDSFVWTNQLSYYLPHTFANDKLRPAINVILPLTGYATEFGDQGTSLRDNGVGLGDLLIGPMLQFSPIMVDERPVFSHRLELDVIAPVGKYDPHKNLNQSSNFVSLHPHWSLSVLPARGLEFTVRLQYIYNFTNRRPVNTPKGLSVDTARAGQTAWLNFDCSYEVVQGLHLGANGYYLKQLTPDRYKLMDGSRTTGSAHGDGKAQVLGIGPGLLWEASKRDRLYANYYFQLLVEDRPRANVLNLRWMHNF